MQLVNTRLHAGGLLVSALATMPLLVMARGASASPSVPAISKWRTVDAPGAGPGGSEVQAINDSGDVAGSFVDAAGVRHGYIRSYNGVYSTIDPPVPNAQLRALVDINNDGEAVGTYWDGQGRLHAMLRTQDGTVITADPPPGIASGGYSEAYGLNDRGEVVGSFADMAGSVRGFIRHPDGSFLLVDPPGIDPATNTTLCNSINDRGEIACNFFSNDVALQIFGGFDRRADGSVYYVAAPAAGTGWFMGTLDGYHRSLNGLGEVTGQYLDPVHLSFGFVRHRSGSYEQFQAPGAGTVVWSGTFPTAINARGTVIGNVADLNYQSHGFARTRQGAMVGIDWPAGGASGTHVYVINASDQFVGTYRDAAGVQHAFMAQVMAGDN